MLRTHLCNTRAAFGLAVLALPLVLASPAVADEKKLGWSNTAELAFVSTSGNAESSTLGFSDTLKNVWENAELRVDFGGLRAKTSTFSRRAIQLPGGGIVIDEDKDSRLSAENYFVRGRYDQNITDGIYWFAGAGWEKNEFAGFKSRVSAVGGIGKTWFDSETAKFKTDAGLTYTDEDPVADVELDAYLGLRLSYDYARKLTATTTYTSGLIIDTNFDETDDYRADFTNAVGVSMTDHLSLKASLRLLYDNQPGLVSVPVVNPLGLPVAGVTALAELDELDSVLSVALVLSY